MRVFVIALLTVTALAGCTDMGEPLQDTQNGATALDVWDAGLAAGERWDPEADLVLVSGAEFDLSRQGAPRELTDTDIGDGRAMAWVFLFMKDGSNHLVILDADGRVVQTDTADVPEEFADVRLPAVPRPGNDTDTASAELREAFSVAWDDLDRGASPLVSWNAVWDGQRFYWIVVGAHDAEAAVSGDLDEEDFLLLQAYEDGGATYDLVGVLPYPIGIIQTRAGLLGENSHTVKMEGLPTDVRFVLGPVAAGGLPTVPGLHVTATLTAPDGTASQLTWTTGEEPVETMLESQPGAWQVDLAVDPGLSADVELSWCGVLGYGTPEVAACDAPVTTMDPIGASHIAHDAILRLV